MEFFKEFENSIKNKSKKNAEVMRTNFILVLNKFLTITPKISEVDKEIIYKTKKVSKYIQEHSEIAFTRADKGNMTQ